MRGTEAAYNAGLPAGAVNRTRKARLPNPSLRLNPPRVSRLWHPPQLQPHPTHRKPPRAVPEIASIPVKNHPNHHSLYASLVLGALSATALAGSELSKPESKNPIEPTPGPSILSGNLGVTVRNQYNVRGIIVESKGVVFQPYGNLFVKLHEGKGLIQSFSLQAGFWGDLNSSGPRAAKDSDWKHFTEFDWDVGFIVNFAERLSLSSYYLQYFSPSDAYDLGRFINSTLSFNDAGLIGDNFSFQPHFTFLYELPAAGRPGFRPNAWYLEPGISPNYTLFKKSKTPVTLALPLTVGLGERFYNGNAYGYTSVGPQVTVGLGFIPENFGRWNSSFGYRYFHLGEAPESIAPGQRSNQHLFNFSVGVNF